MVLAPGIARCRFCGKLLPEDFWEKAAAMPPTDPSDRVQRITATYAVVRPDGKRRASSAIMPAATDQVALPVGPPSGSPPPVDAPPSPPRRAIRVRDGSTAELRAAMFSAPEVQTPWRRWVAIAAAVAGLLVGAYFIFRSDGAAVTNGNGGSCVDRCRATARAAETRKDDPRAVSAALQGCVSKCLDPRGPRPETR